MLSATCYTQTFCLANRVLSVILCGAMQMRPLAVVAPEEVVEIELLLQ